MNILEKILEEIDTEIQKQRELCKDLKGTPGYRLYEKAAAVFKGIVAKYMNAADDGWIPVSERLPEKPKYIYDSYIVQQDGAVEPFSAYWDGEKWTDIDDYEVKGVIAWQPLPEPYKGGE